eukprot:gene3746-4670_t
MPLKDLIWLPIKNPRAGVTNSLRATILQNLQSRELTTQDYDLLLSLDNVDIANLPAHVISALPQFDETVASTLSSTPMNKCFCDNPDMNPEVTARRIPFCGHVCHDACLDKVMSEGLADGYWVLGSLMCPHNGCDKRILPGLNRQRRRRLIETTSGGEHAVEAGALKAGSGSRGAVGVDSSGLEPLGIAGVACGHGHTGAGSAPGDGRIRSISMPAQALAPRVRLRPTRPPRDRSAAAGGTSTGDALELNGVPRVQEGIAAPGGRPLGQERDRDPSPRLSRVSAARAILLDSNDPKRVLPVSGVRGSKSAPTATTMRKSESAKSIIGDQSVQLLVSGGWRSPAAIPAMLVTPRQQGGPSHGGRSDVTFSATGMQRG